NRITSVRQSLALLGEDAVRKWASVVALAGLAHEQPSELLVSSLVRARFCEVIAASVKLEERGQELFLMGLFSLLDAITGRPMHDILANLPLADDIKMALLGNRNRLRDVLACGSPTSRPSGKRSGSSPPSCVSMKVRPRGSISRPSSGRLRATPGPTGPADRPPRRPGAPGVG